MTLEDPFYVVKDEVFKALNKTRGLYLRWMEITKYPNNLHTPEVEWTSTELRNALRSIEWDLEDLEDTISIVERNACKFKIDSKEIFDRRIFIDVTKKEIEYMRGKATINRNHDHDGQAEVSIMHSPRPFRNFFTSTPKKYIRLTNQGDSPFSQFKDTMAQEEMLMIQDNQLDMIRASAASQRTVCEQIGAELDEQMAMLDDVNMVVDNTNSTLKTNLKKLKNVLKINNDRRQWVIIAILLALLFIILLLFITI